MKHTKEQAKYSVPAFEHGLDLLELLLASPHPLTQKVIANQTDKPVSSVFRLLNCLEHRGYVQRDAQTGGYRPTLRLYSLSQLCPAHQRFREVAMAPMQQLAGVIGESCHLSIREGARVRVVYNQPSPHMHSLNVSEDSTYSLVDTTAGSLILAHMPTSDRQRVLENLAEYLQLAPTQRAALEKRLRSLGRKRTVVVPSESTPGVLDVDCLLKDAWLGDDAVLAVPCIKKWSKSDRDKTLLPTVDAAAKQIQTILTET